MTRRSSCTCDAFPSIWSRETTSPSTKRPKFDDVNKESKLNQIDFKDVFGIPFPQILDDTSQHDVTDSLSIHEMCTVSVGSEGKLAQTSAPSQVETKEIADIFQRIEAIYI